jgi:DNA-binding response OmpR family regulator
MGNAKIVVTDDDPEIRDAMRAFLETRGYTALTAADRDEGMATIRRERPDLVILDVMMASWQDGFEMSREIKKEPELKSIPILMLTAIGQRTGIDFKSSAGDPTWLPVDSFLEKPVEPDVLFSRIEELLLDKARQERA